MKFTPFFDVEAWCSQPFGVTEYALGDGASRYAKDSITGLPYHEGADFYIQGGRETWPVFAFTGGRIMWAGWGDTYGWNIILFDERHRMSYRFCHLDLMNVKEGDIVKVGDLLGMCGNTGKSAGAHLHLNAIPMSKWSTKLIPWNGRKGRIDPLGLLIAHGINI